MIERGEDPFAGAKGYIGTGSGEAWKETGQQDKYGRKILKRNDAVSEYARDHKAPGIDVCGSGHALMGGLGYKVVNTGKYNRGKGEDGRMYHHKYGIPAEQVNQGLGKKLSGVETIDHDGKKYVKAANYKNKRFVQYHPEREDTGEITSHFDKHLGYKMAA